MTLSQRTANIYTALDQRCLNGQIWQSNTINQFSNDLFILNQMCPLNPGFAVFWQVPQLLKKKSNFNLSITQK